jgi:hypothetical protein
MAVPDSVMGGALVAACAGWFVVVMLESSALAAEERLMRPRAASATVHRFIVIGFACVICFIFFLQ